MTLEEFVKIKDEAYKRHFNCAASICYANEPALLPTTKCAYARMIVQLVEDQKKIKPIRVGMDPKFIETGSTVAHWVDTEVEKRAKEWLDQAKGADWTAIFEQTWRENNSLKDDVKKLRKALVDIYNVLPVNRPTDLDHLGFLYDISKLTFDALKPSNQSVGGAK